MLILRHEMFFPRAFVIFTLTASALGQGTSGYKSELDALTERLTHEVQLARKQFLFPKILVIDFLNQEGKVNALGEHLADQLSNALAERLRPADVVARQKFREYLLSTGISPFDLQNTGDALWTAGKAGANVIVFGHLLSSEQKMTLVVQLIRVSDAKQLSTASADLSLTEKMKSLIDKPVDWPTSLDVVVPCIATQHGAFVAAFKAAGVSEPKCIHCPSASYSNEARKAKYQGAVKLNVVIDEKGHVRSAVVTKADPYGLDARSLIAARQWQFEPAMKNGKPVAVCVPIEMTFRLY
jgi:TonB family protein